jgi:hypothetical protein
MYPYVHLDESLQNTAKRGERDYVKQGQVVTCYSDLVSVGFSFARGYICAMFASTP